MFAMILRTHWAWTRMQVGAIALIAFLAPAIALQLTGSVGATDMTRLIEGLSSLLGLMMGFVALLGAFILAVYPWTLDAETKHVYPLSLPISWSRYVAMRYLAGALTLLVPTAALFVGVQLAVTMLELPPLLKAYPGAFSLRFLLAALVAYSASFALQYLAGRRAIVVALIIMLAMGFVFMVLTWLGRAEYGVAIGEFLFEWPGPFGIFSSSWALIDV